uniref:UBC core domain-containing protein n=1 Tax=viral metagenome TaxID=1070528 RepID=A0A6C0J6Z2_9ZZZZ
MSKKRLNKEWKALQEEKDAGTLGFKINPTDDKMLKWNAVIKGPVNTVWKDLIINIDITIPQQYPFKAPIPIITSPIMHPNILDGAVCLSSIVLWTPAKNIKDILLEIISKLEVPDWENRVITEPHDREEFLKQANLYTLKNIL